ncbi:MAG: hypothetical protein ACI9B8_000731 [Sulfitobacter sp.]|jgi:hypothetical protein
MRKPQLPLIQALVFRAVLALRTASSTWKPYGALWFEVIHSVLKNHKTPVCFTPNTPLDIERHGPAGNSLAVKNHLTLMGLLWPGGETQVSFPYFQQSLESPFSAFRQPQLGIGPFTITRCI